MNDFTKEELGSIFLDMNHNILKAGKNNVAPFYLNLRDKVESMINNYCEHKPNKQNFTQEQKDFMCWQIGEWYLMMKPLLEGRHNLGYMKEKLKIMVCDD